MLGEEAEEPAEPEAPKPPKRSRAGKAQQGPAPSPEAPKAKETSKESPAAPQQAAIAKPERDAAAELDGVVLAGGYERVMERIFVDDPWVTYKAVEAGLRLKRPVGEMDYATTATALDEAAEIATKAHRLYVSAKVIVARYEGDLEVLLADMRDQATAKLQAEKDAKQRSKAITDADVRSYMAAMFPDEWRRTEERLTKARSMMEHLKQWADVMRSRESDLRAIVESMRGVR